MAPRVLLLQDLRLAFPASAGFRLIARRAFQQEDRLETAARDILILLKRVLFHPALVLLHSRFPPGVLLASTFHLRLLQRSPPLCSAFEVDSSGDLVYMTLVDRLQW
jgi:hypothetical protein